MIEDSAPSLAKMPLWRRVLPAGLGAGLVLFVLSRVDLPTFYATLRSTHYVVFVVFSLVFTLALLGADTWATVWVYRRTVCPVKSREFFLVRGASYLPAVLNHHLGQGWVTYFMAKMYGAPLWRVAGATLVVYATTFACVVGLGVVAVVLAGPAVPWLPPLVGAVVVAGLLYLAALRFFPAALRRRQATAVLAELGPLGHLEAVLRRFPHVLVQFLGTWAAFWFFDIRVPPTAAFAFIPVVMMLATLPITPAGVGTRDVLSVEFFAAFAPGAAGEREATVAACTLTWITSLVLLQALLGPFFMRATRRLLERSARSPQPRSP